MIAITGFAEAARRVVEAAETLGIPLDLYVCDPLGNGDRCFSAESSAFRSDAEREGAREVAESYGRRLQRKFPLGYADLQATVVFDESCPNGALPILWDTSGDWHALFPRHKGR
ncbi:hypothetical protein [Conexibacter sp. S30A1]|uniref:phosphoribosyltransferase-like protein n=1 Tax=Conexibacter sp. S30A1 TaxID=2937800 RepID=UPI00200E44E9|nr:hypothetical protein [Conexibacter sp. S30A1]